MLDTEDTIVAIASASGAGLRGVIRVSGPRSVEVLGKCFVSTDGTALDSLQHAAIVAGTIRVLDTNREIPGRLYVWPTRRSYTGQPSTEFHTFGARPLLESVVRELRRAGARLAEPGEFTMRAFLAGRIDLTQAEAVLGVIDAESASQVEVALKQLAGGVARPLHAMRDRMLNLLADIEAGLDFVDEDIEFIAAEQIERELLDYLEATAALLEEVRHRELPQHEYRIVFRGTPNVGKSSLMNALVQDAVSIVADEAGTTRDYVERRCEIRGMPCLLADTAGIDADHSDRIDAASQEQTRRQVSAAHLELLCLDASRSLNAWERVELQEGDKKRIVVWTKADRVNEERLAEFPEGVVTSAVTGEGIDRLLDVIAAKLWSELGEVTGVVATTATRCVGSLESAREALSRAIDICRQQGGDEVLAFELRQALHDLGVVAGVVYTDDVLDRVFSRFCIGK